MGLSFFGMKPTHSKLLGYFSGQLLAFDVARDLPLSFAFCRTIGQLKARIHIKGMAQIIIVELNRSNAQHTGLITGCVVCKHQSISNHEHLDPKINAYRPVRYCVCYFVCFSRTILLL